MAYIKGIARKRFNYWDDWKGTIILEDYVNALETKGWTEEMIVEYLEKEVTKMTKQASSWSNWRNIIEGWTEDIHKW